MQELRFRQIHMDFHTSEKIAGVGERFDADVFADTLQNAHVNSVTLFGRCHHGLLYYDSKRFPELVHPGLTQKNLLERQIDACHKRGIRAPVYTTVQWDYYMSQAHPEWVCLAPDGSLLDACAPDGRSGVYEAGFYRTLCVNTPYRDFLKAQIADMFESLTPPRVDGLFLDIVTVEDCSCAYCVRGMLENGMNPEKKEDRIRYARCMMTEFKRDMTAFIRSMKPDVSIFYNAGHVGPEAVDAKDAYTHWELESLPGGDWGYSHFVNTVRYARTTGMDYLAQTGKFHTAWGDFHSFKNPEALQYECFRMLAYNAKCLVGDQLHPDGEISQPVYDLIGNVYAEVEKKEPWCSGAKALVDIAVLSPECLTDHTGPGGSVPEEVSGACAMLDELGMQFDIIDDRGSLSDYSVIILPDSVICKKALAQRLNEYIRGGGKLIASYRSGLAADRGQFALELGIKYNGEAPYSSDFVMPNDVIGKRLPKTEHVMYLQSALIEADGAQVIMDAYVPYFNRTWEHFCSHRHTPSRHEKGYPAALKKEGSVYFAHPVFTIYAKKHPRWCREMLRDALDMLLSEPALKTNGPTTLVSTVNVQAEHNRYVVHLLHYIPVKACEELYTIDDVIPLYNVQCAVRTQREVKRVVMVPEMRELDFACSGGYARFTVPRVNGHAMIAVEF